MQPERKIRRSNKSRTICEVFRDINDLVQGDSEEDKKIRVLLLEAFQMGKSIVMQLLEYNKLFFKDYWEQNPERERKIKEDLRRDINYKIG